MKTEPLMTFEQWWDTVARPHMFERAPTNEASAFIQSVARSAAEKAWDFSRVAFIEELNRAARKTEQEMRERAKKPG